MSWSDVFRDRYYEPGYVYIAGSLSDRVIKIGVTKNIWSQQNYLRNRKYGGIDDWFLLYHVWVDEGGRVEHDARRRLRRFQVLKMYTKDGRRQKGREIVRCSFGTALEALSYFIGEDARSSAWQSGRCRDFEFAKRNNHSASNICLTNESASPPPKNAHFNPFFLKTLNELELSVRTSNCLKNDNIVYIGDLLQKTEAEMLRTPNFGRKSLNEIKEVIVQMGLQFGMRISGWPPENVEKLSAYLETPFFNRVDELELSVRTSNCLKNDNIVYIGDLLQKTEAEMLRTPNFGRKALNEIKDVIAQMGLRLGMEVPGWPPGNVEELFK